MDEMIEKSCWGVTLRVVAGFVVLVVLAYLFDGI